MRLPDSCSEFPCHAQKRQRGVQGGQKGGCGACHAWKGLNFDGMSWEGAERMGMRRKSRKKRMPCNLYGCYSPSRLEVKELGYYSVCDREVRFRMLWPRVVQMVVQMQISMIVEIDMIVVMWQ